MSKKRKIIVTGALVYANGPLHLGHLVEYIQADIWCRFQKLNGHDCLYISGDDAHGTPIMLTAKQKNISPEALIDTTLNDHKQDLKDFHIALDNFYTTHSPENEKLVNLFYARFNEKKDVTSRHIEQAYDEQENLFLPDRFIKGDCPFCNAPDQYGDNCEACGATYTPSELKNPRSVLSGTTPIKKTSLHYFFELKRYEPFLKKWLQSGPMQPQITNKLLEWFKDGLKAWNISRDAPYFGFKIPNTPDKYFYVWLDAPIGYMASLQNLCNKTTTPLPFSFDDVWKPDSTVELYHFIGKDIIYFHGLFWPAILASANFRQPTALFAHGFLTINGQKMSKSRGTFITARHYLKHVNPEGLRYYFASKLNSQIEDINFNPDDFKQRINTDLVGKLVNIASRCAGFIHRGFDGMLSETLCEPALFEHFLTTGNDIASHFEQRDFSHAVRLITALADQTNQYIETEKPWAVAKHNPNDPAVQSACSMGLNLFRLLVLYLKPILPHLGAKAEQFLQEPTPLTWATIKTPLLGHRINPYKPLMQRITQEEIDRLLGP